MRVPKYRAWDKSPKEMIKVNTIYFNNPNGIYINSLLADDMVLMQYTGLKDDDGKEIYEGDVVEHNFIGKSEKIVISHENYYDSRSYIESVINSIAEMQKQLFCYVRVIGNIYEHSHLYERS